MTKKPAAKIIHRPNELAEKIERFDGVSVGDLIARSNAEVAVVAKDYESWAEVDLSKLQAVVARLKDRSAPQAPNIAAAFRIAADVRDQGSVCGYPLISVVAGLLCKFVDEVKTLDDQSIALVDAHVDSLHTILAQGIGNDSPALAEHLVSHLKVASGKLLRTNR